MGEYSKLRLLSEFLPIIAHVHPSIIDVNCFILGTFARRKTQSTLYVPSSCCFNSFNGPYLHTLVFVALSKNHLKQYFSYVSSLCLGTGVGSTRNRRGISDIQFFVFIFYFQKRIIKTTKKRRSKNCIFLLSLSLSPFDGKMVLVNQCRVDKSGFTGTSFDEASCQNLQTTSTRGLKDWKPEKLGNIELSLSLFPLLLVILQQLSARTILQLFKIAPSFQKKIQNYTEDTILHRNQFFHSFCKFFCIKKGLKFCLRDVTNCPFLFINHSSDYNAIFVQTKQRRGKNEN